MKSTNVIIIFSLSILPYYGVLSQIVTDSEIAVKTTLETDEGPSIDLVDSPGEDKYQITSHNEKAFSLLQKLKSTDYNRSAENNKDFKNILRILIDVHIKGLNGTNSSSEGLKTDTLGIIIIVLVSLAIFAILLSIWLCFLYRGACCCRDGRLKRFDTRRQSDMSWIVNNQNQ